MSRASAGHATNRSNPILGVVLAGGRSRRFGRNKAEHILPDGRTMLAHVIDRLSPQVDRVCISGGQNAAQYAAYDLSVLEDGPYTDCGPAAGFVAALEQVQTYGADSLVAVCPCDTPEIPSDMIAHMLIGLGHAHAAFAVTEDDQHYAHSILRPSSLPIITQALNNGQRSLRHIHDVLKSVPVSMTCAGDVFCGHNTPP